MASAPRKRLKLSSRPRAPLQAQAQPPPPQLQAPPSEPQVLRCELCGETLTALSDEERLQHTAACSLLAEQVAARLEQERTKAEASSSGAQPPAAPAP